MAHQPIARLLPRAFRALAAAPALYQAQHVASCSYASTSSARHEAGASGWSAGALSLAAAAGFATAATANGASADAPAPTRDAPPADPYARPAPGPLPKSIVLYQYEVCPFCCKVKAFLDYHKLPYETVEVNPLTKGELKWSVYRKVPVVKLDGATVVVDSSAIMSQLAADVEAAGAKGSGKAAGGWLHRGGGRGGGGGVSADEEARWRRWVDERFVKVMTANIYRSWDETWDTFSYITGQSHWNWASQQAVRLGGALIMWRVGAGMPKKYGIEGDLRGALYEEMDRFVGALGGADFLGGARPNLADLSLFGVLRAVAGTPTYNDIIVNTTVGPWLARMTMAVGPSAEVKRSSTQARASAP